jgi:hypothetical protein
MPHTEGIPYTVGGVAMKRVYLPDDVYKRASEMAARDHVSVNRFVAAVVNERAGDRARLRARAKHGSVAKLRRVLSKVKDVAPIAADRL